MILTHDIFFRTHFQFNEHSSVPPSLSSLISQDDSHDTTLDVLDVEDTPIAPPDVVAPTPPVTMPKWARTAVEEATLFIQDLPPSHHHSAGTGLVSQANPGVLQSFLEAHGILEWDDAMAAEYSSLMKN